MKYMISLLVIAGLISSCDTPYQLEGKWAGRDPEGSYMEIWFGDSLALSYFQSYDEFILYDYSHSENTIEFKVRESNLTGANEFENTIVSLDADTLILQYDWPSGAIQRFNYQRVSSSLPTIYPDGLNTHLEQYREEILGE
jgi:hypothetical protein